MYSFQNEKFSINVLRQHGLLMMHADVFAEWTPSLRREFTGVCKKIAREFDYPVVFAQGPTNDLKHYKWVKMCGFKLISHGLSKDGPVSVYRMDSKCYK
jgi:hypothetical protein